MAWLYLTLGSYFILAAVNITDSFLLKKIVNDERVYTFIIGILGLLALIAVPFADFTSLSVGEVTLDVMAGVAFAFALMLFFSALKAGDASVVVPFIGGGVPIFVALLSWFILGERFSGLMFFGIVFLLFGGVVITLIPRKTRHWWNFFQKAHPVGIGRALLSVFLFSVFFVITKHTFNTQGFLPPFIIARFGTFLGVMWLLFDRTFRMHIKKFVKKTLVETRYVFYINQFFGALGFVGLNIAISLHSVTLVNALQGIQYVFVLIFVSGLTVLFPNHFTEDISKKVIVEKSFAVVLIAVGLVIIAMNQ